MPAAYIPLLIYSLLVISFPAIALLVFKLIRHEPVGPTKFPSHESSLPAESNVAGRYRARLFVLAMLFVIFDVATIFLLVWAIPYRSLLTAHAGAFALMSIFVFLGILLVGYIWLYKKGVLDRS
jgi:NADH-quinone oxidoreductase subunit A